MSKVSALTVALNRIGKIKIIQTGFPYFLFVLLDIQEVKAPLAK